MLAYLPYVKNSFCVIEKNIGLNLKNEREKIREYKWGYVKYVNSLISVFVIEQK